MLAGCSVQKEQGIKGEKKVDIRTPFGDIKVNTDVDAKDTGLPVYPGSQRVIEAHDEHAANLNISSGTFGLKVVAIKFRSDDPPSKVLDFYRPKMRGFGGQYLECQREGLFTYSHPDDKSTELRCDNPRSRGESTELKAGTPDRQHIVAVKPSGSGSEFALVYVSKHEKEGM